MTMGGFFMNTNSNEVLTGISDNLNCITECKLTVHQTDLPSAEEYRDMAEKSAFYFQEQWSEPKYRCPKCGGGMRKDLTKVLTSLPPKYEYECDKCGHVEYQYI